MGNASPDPTGQALTRLRVALGLSARQLAKQAGVSHSVVTKAERGGALRRSAVDALAVILGPTVYEAVSVVGWPTEDTAVARACREQRVSITEAAARAGVGYDVMRRALRGDGIHPGNAKRIADALGLAVVDVLPIPQRNGDDDREAA